MADNGCGRTPESRMCSMRFEGKTSQTALVCGGEGRKLILCREEQVFVVDVRSSVLLKTSGRQQEMQLRVFPLSPKERKRDPVASRKEPLAYLKVASATPAT